MIKNQFFLSSIGSGTAGRAVKIAEYTKDLLRGKTKVDTFVPLRWANKRALVAGGAGLAAGSIGTYLAMKRKKKLMKKALDFNTGTAGAGGLMSLRGRKSNKLDNSKQASFSKYLGVGTALGAGAGALRAYQKNKKLDPLDPNTSYQKKEDYKKNILWGAGIGAGAGAATGYFLPGLVSSHLNSKLNRKKEDYIAKRLAENTAIKRNLNPLGRLFAKTRWGVKRTANKELKNLKRLSNFKPFANWKELRSTSKYIKSQLSN